MAERREVRSWRSRAVEAPLKASGDGLEANERQQSHQSHQTSLTRREIEDSAGTSNCLQTVIKPLDVCLIARCDAKAIDIVYCAEHRRMADDGTLWLRCVNHPERPVAPFDPIVCPECRVRLDAIDMPGYPSELSRGAL